MRISLDLIYYNFFNFYFILEESWFGEENGNPLQYSWLRNAVNRGAWWATVWGVSRVRHDLANNQKGLISYKIILKDDQYLKEEKTISIKRERYKRYKPCATTKMVSKSLNSFFRNIITTNHSPNHPSLCGGRSIVTWLPYASSSTHSHLEKTNKLSSETPWSSGMYRFCMCPCVNYSLQGAVRIWNIV